MISVVTGISIAVDNSIVADIIFQVRSLLWSNVSDQQ
jgi:hypothetical protein